MLTIIQTFLPHNAAAGLTDEEKIAREQQITAVTDACYDAVGKYVLHLHDAYMVRGGYQLELDMVQVQKVISE